MIISAAVIIEMNGEKICIPCHRHGDAYTILHRLGISRNSYKTIEQGFIAYTPDPEDSFNGEEIFLNREEARLHAILCGQIDKEDCLSFNELYSEDLW